MVVMNKVVVLMVVSTLTASAFIAGVAVGKAPPPTPKFTAAEEVKWDDINGVKLALLYGDIKKGPYGGLIKLPAGHTSPLSALAGAYEAVQISGTSSHWLRGEDGTKAKKMTPGSYWTIPAKLEHVSACAAGAECVLFMWQKTKFDVTVAKDAAATGSAGMAAGSGGKPMPPTLPAVAPKAGAGTGSAAKK